MTKYFKEFFSFTVIPNNCCTDDREPQKLRINVPEGQKTYVIWRFYGETCSTSEAHHAVDHRYYTMLLSEVIVDITR